MIDDVLDEQRERWKAGSDRASVEDYLAQNPALMLMSTESVLDLIYQEILPRGAWLGDHRPGREEYTRRDSQLWTEV